jgi:hypothetical protein
MAELQQSNRNARSKLISQLETMLGGGMVDVELRPQDYDLAVDLSLEKYRQRAENSVEEAFIFMSLQKGKNDYILPNEVVEVRQIFRKNFGVASGSSDSNEGTFDPFDLAFTNLYVLQDGNLGGLATYDFYAQNLELAGRMFGYHYNFSWHSATKRLKIARNVRTDEEEVLLWVYNYIPDEGLIKDTYAGPWLRSYALAESKFMLGQAYEKFSQLSGPQGGVTLNGSQLKSEAIQEKTDLEEQLKKYTTGSMPLGFILG